MFAKAKEILRYRQMLESLVLTDLRVRYKGSVLGFFWTLLNPILMLLVYSVVFKYVVRISMENYTAYLFIGLSAWYLFNGTLLTGSGVIIRNAGLVKKIYFPKEILPLSVVLGATVNYLFSLIVLFPILIYSGIHLGWNLFYFPLILLVYIIFSFALCLIVSCLNVYFRDLEHILGILLMAWFYLTPIVFTSEMIPSDLKWVFNLNPVKTIIVSFQDIFFYNHSPDIRNLLLVTAAAVFLLFFALKLFSKLSRNFAEEI